MKIITQKKMKLKQVALSFNLSDHLIKACNEHLTTSFIQKGDFINIPGYQLIKYNLKKDDTLQTICHHYEITQQMIEICNNNLDSDILYIPEKITEPIVSDVNNYTFEKMMSHIKQLIKIFPFIQKNIIGHSVLNRPIIELSIGTGLYHTHFNSSFHGNEWITSAVLMRCVNDFANLLTNNSKLDSSLMDTFAKTKLSIVPMVNPDGVNLVINGAETAAQYGDNVIIMNNNHDDFSDWKANIVGVDLNKQFPALWKVEQARKQKYPTYRDFPGEKPLSQPESMTMAKFTNNNNFKRVHTFHTQGEEIYWGFQQQEPEIAGKIAQYYSRVTNYKSVKYINNYAGYKDWFIKKFRRPGFTIELGKGKNPLPISEFQNLYEPAYNLFLTNLALIV